MNIFNSVFPIILSMFIGYLIANYWLRDGALWDGLNKIVYYIMFPALIVNSLMHADIGDLDKSFIIVLNLLVILLIFILWCLKPLFKDKLFWITFIQGSFRYNSYVFIGVTLIYLGPSSIPAVAIITGSMIFTSTIIGTFLLSLYASDKANFSSSIVNVIKNPLVISCLVGGVLNYIAIDHPQLLQINFINNSLDILGKASLAVSLLAIGAGISVKLKKRMMLGVINCSIVKLLIFPLMVVYTMLYFEYDRQLILICMLYAAAPGSTSASIMIKQIGGDYQAINNIIGTQTALCTLTIPLLLFLFPYMNI